MSYNILNDRRAIQLRAELFRDLFAVKIGTFEQRLERFESAMRRSFGELTTEDIGATALEETYLYSLLDFLEVDYWGKGVAFPENWHKIRTLYQRYGVLFLKAIYDLDNHRDPWPVTSQSFYKKVEDLYYARNSLDRADRQVNSLMLSLFVVKNFADPTAIWAMLSTVNEAIEDQYQGSDCWLDSSARIPPIVIQPVEIK